MRTPVALPPILQGVEQGLQKRRRIQQTETLENGLTQAAVRLRQQAGGTPPGLEREYLIRRARQAETASHINEWLSSPRAARTEPSPERSVDARERFGRSPRLSGGSADGKGLPCIAT
jgi:hypothetical protein